jgi:hypothetical protein
MSDGQFIERGTLDYWHDRDQEQRSDIKRLIARIEELEAKLAKAMSALSGHSTARCFGSGEVLGLSLSDSPMGREVLARMDHARTILAELKGEDRG